MKRKVREWNKCLSKNFKYTDVLSRAEALDKDPLKLTLEDIGYRVEQVDTAETSVGPPIESMSPPEEED